jgi:hypothetical protein
VFLKIIASFSVNADRAPQLKESYASTSMYAWRITKYNPAFRDERGAYLQDEWTGISDIEAVYDGEALTYAAYRKV